jgi:Xaa-Pro aminopeptidase
MAHTTSPLADSQRFMIDRRIDAWLVHDFRNTNPIFARLLPSPTGGPRHVTRRLELIIPARGTPTLIAHAIDASQFEGATLAGGPLTLVKYTSWSDLHQALRTALAGHARVAMEYSPGGSLPVMGIVDAGTVELIRSLGVEVVSSADLVQVSVAGWGAALEEHRRASTIVDGIKDRAFGHIAKSIRDGSPIFEHTAAQFIRDQFKAAGLEWPDGPIVAVNAHAGDPHFEPSAANPTPIRAGDWILIDLWARVPGDHNIYSDITWTGFAGRDVPAEHRRVFDTVLAARDASLKLAQDSWSRGTPVQGWQLDDAARSVIIDAGFASAIRHRTGHSLSPGKMVHGLGMNLDNLETRDTRQMLPGTGFTIEPGIYLPDAPHRLGVRSEINVYVDPASGPIVTSGIQREPLLAI